METWVCYIQGIAALINKLLPVIIIYLPVLYFYIELIMLILLVCHQPRSMFALWVLSSKTEVDYIGLFYYSQLSSYVYSLAQGQDGSNFELES